MSPDQGCALVSSLTLLRLYPASPDNRPPDVPTAVYRCLGSSERKGGLQSEVKEEGWRSQPGGHERRRSPFLSEPARSMHKT
jgi:hypothetical protein